MSSEFVYKCQFVLIQKKQSKCLKLKNKILLKNLFWITVCDIKNWSYVYTVITDCYKFKSFKTGQNFKIAPSLCPFTSYCPQLTKIAPMVVNCLCLGNPVLHCYRTKLL